MKQQPYLVVRVVLDMDAPAGSTTVRESALCMKCGLAFPQITTGVPKTCPHCGAPAELLENLDYFSDKPLVVDGAPPEDHAWEIDRLRGVLTFLPHAIQAVTVGLMTQEQYDSCW